MESMMGREGGSSPRHYLVRKFLTRLQEHVSKADAVYECWGNGGISPEVAAREIDRHIDYAERYAGKGLALIANHCLAMPNEGRANQTREKLATVRRIMLADIRSGSPASDGLGRFALEEFREMLLAFSIDISPEDTLRDMVLDSSDGLRLVREVEPCVCPVTLQGGENDKLCAIVNGKVVLPPLSTGMYRALAKMSRALLSGNVGIPRRRESKDDHREVLGVDQGELSRLINGKNHDPIWAMIIFTPRTRGPKGAGKLYGITPS